VVALDEDKTRRLGFEDGGVEEGSAAVACAERFMREGAVERKTEAGEGEGPRYSEFLESKQCEQALLEGQELDQEARASAGITAVEIEERVARGEEQETGKDEPRPRFGPLLKCANQKEEKQWFEVCEVEGVVMVA